VRSVNPLWLRAAGSMGATKADTVFPEHRSALQAVLK
jgi:hypothetical protein